MIYEVMMIAWPTYLWISSGATVVVKTRQKGWCALVNSYIHRSICLLLWSTYFEKREFKKKVNILRFRWPHIQFNAVLLDGCIKKLLTIIQRAAWNDNADDWDDNDDEEDPDDAASPVRYARFKENEYFSWMN